jgi:outer membrane biosynthesis protein TonB
MSTDGAFRTCPHCATRNRHYMLVCTRCARSLEGVPLVGTPPPGSVVGVSSLSRRLTVAVLAVLVGLAAAVMLSRALRSSPLERDAAAASRAEGEERPSSADAADPGGWETIEQRFAELRPPPTAPRTPPESPAAVTPSAPASTPAAVSLLPALAPVAPATPAPVPTTVVSAEPTTEPEPVERPAPVRSPPTPRADPAAKPTEAEVRDGFTSQARDDDPGRVRSERRAALRRAQERLRSLERRAEDLRRTEDDSADPEDRERQERERAKVLRQLEEAERQVVRAEWALREVEP